MQYKIFCANCQDDTAHEAELVNGEIICTCQNPVTTKVVNPETQETEDDIKPCGRFIKVPASLSADEIKAFVLAHKEANAGQIPVDEVKIAAEKKAHEENMVNALSEFSL